MSKLQLNPDAFWAIGRSRVTMFKGDIEYDVKGPGLLVPRDALTKRIAVPYEDVDWLENGLTIGGASIQWETLIAPGSTTAGAANGVYSNANANLSVGDSSTAFADTQTELQAATNRLRKVMDATYPLHTDSTGTAGSKSISFRSTYGTSDANWAWNEWGLFNGPGTGGPPTTANLTFTNRITTNNAGNVKFYAWTATAGASNSSQTIAGSVPSSQEGGYVAEVWRDHGGLGNIGTANLGTSGAGSASLNVSALDSAVSVAWGDWNAVAGARTFITTNLGAATEDHYYTSGSYASTSLFHNADTSATGVQTIGITAPTSTKWTVVGLEILGAADSSSSSSASGPGGRVGMFDAQLNGRMWF
jgi:hypothetical protein